MQTSPRNFTPMPSFGAVFGEEARNNHLKNSSDTDKAGPHGSLVRSVTSGNTHSGVPFSSFHIHRDSRDSTSTASSDNSPTTTISTMDSSTVTDPSPGPSPESPVAKTPSSSFVADFRSRRTENPSQDSSTNTFFELARPTTPAKKPRNLKNLGINTSSSLGNLRTAQNATTLVVEKKEKNTSAPASPSFIKPPTPPKRRPSNLSLTISTPGSNDNKPMRLIIPSTPAGSRPTLRHFQSSPSLPLCSPSVGPSGGMKMPVLRHVPSKPSGLSEVPYEMEEEEDQEPNFDVPQSREEKPAAYPNGPIEIYPSGIFLYFEPTVEQACTFDVIINVASEVKNPFTTPVSETSKDLNARRIDGPAAENPDFAALPNRAGDNNSSPPTPKAAPAMAVMQPGERVIDGKLYKTPEYIHMPWEHNTDIVADLYKLVKTMDDRVQQGKRVLVHCQCGVSRSASLIVAYGIYKNPETSVQETYDIVKKRSKWIGPNMSLIMQLQEYRNTLTKGTDNRSYLGQPSFGRRSAGLPTGISTATNRHSPFDRDISSAPRTPRTAPLPPDTDMNLQRASTGSMIMLSPGPLSAPSGSSMFSPGFRQSWAASQTQFDLSPKSSPKTTPYVDPAGHVVPMLAISNDDAKDKPQTPPVDETPSDREATLKPLFVPSFSRKLPFRTNDKSSAPERPRTSPAPSGLHVPPAPLSFEPLRSPAVPTFNIPTFTPDSDDDMGLRSPIKASFNLSPWPSTHGYSTESSPTAERFPLSPLPLSLGPSEPYQNDLHVPPEASTELFSPLASTFNLERPPPGSGTSDGHLPSDDFEVTSPVRTEFPSDMFGSADDAKNDLTSPRAAEFHMTPLKPKEEDEDPFGLTSPTRFEFPSDLHKRTGLTPPRFTQPDFRRPSFQAILPPSHLAQPETSNGFASLDGTAHAPASMPSMEQPKSPDSRIDSVGTLSEQSASSSTHALSSHESSQVQPITPQAPFHAISTPTPPRQPGLRARFSSPNMRDQRKLHKLQTEMESMLPHRTPPRAQALDDLHALMSPRAEEFTRNPFHFDLPVTTDENSSASSLETVKEGQTRSEWTEKRQWTPQKSLDDDPRSPVQGSSPIVRNIWDVL
ncbi:unnamed protein product [Periconia digitata]|uniref:protein-tyrosine-phosphatase n=1 Tax=Periconia digitata TaxID=1303443 RepID=A0A9W4XIT8_9PLEO|nr:unnamed protein product [Periconia digitata]